MLIHFYRAFSDSSTTSDDSSGPFFYSLFHLRAKPVRSVAPLDPSQLRESSHLFNSKDGFKRTIRKPIPSKFKKHFAKVRWRLLTDESKRNAIFTPPSESSPSSASTSSAPLPPANLPPSSKSNNNKEDSSGYVTSQSAL